MSGLITDYIGVGVIADRPSPPDIATGATALYYATDTLELSIWDGSAWNVMGAAYAVPTGFGDTPESSEVLLIHTFVDTVVFASDFAGAEIFCGTHPTGSFAMDVQKSTGGGSPASVGTLTVSTGGALTAVTSGGALTCDPGDALLIVAPSSADATIANTAVTLKGVRS